MYHIKSFTSCCNVLFVPFLGHAQGMLVFSGCFGIRHDIFVHFVANIEDDTIIQYGKNERVKLQV